MGLYKKNQDGESLFAGKGKSVVNHNDLTGKDANNSHPISAITNLQTVLDNIQSEVNNKATQETTTNLQGQINSLVLSPGASTGDVTNEVVQARTGIDGKSQATLNDRITHDVGQLKEQIHNGLYQLGSHKNFTFNVSDVVDRQTKTNGELFDETNTQWVSTVKLFNVSMFENIFLKTSEMRGYIYYYSNDFTFIEREVIENKKTLSTGSAAYARLCLRYIDEKESDINDMTSKILLNCTTKDDEISEELLDSKISTLEKELKDETVEVEQTGMKKYTPAFNYKRARYIVEDGELKEDGYVDATKIYKCPKLLLINFLTAEERLYLYIGDIINGMFVPDKNYILNVTSTGYANYCNQANFIPVEIEEGKYFYFGKTSAAGNDYEVYGTDIDFRKCYEVNNYIPFSASPNTGGINNPEKYYSCIIPSESHYIVIPDTNDHSTIFTFMTKDATVNPDKTYVESIMSNKWFGFVPSGRCAFIRSRQYERFGKDIHVYLMGKQYENPHGKSRVMREVAEKIQKYFIFESKVGIPWSDSANLMKAGKYFEGIPYSSYWKSAHYVGFDVTPFTALSAAADEYSIFYDKTPSRSRINAGRGGTGYGTVCSAYISLISGNPYPQSNRGMSYDSNYEIRMTSSISSGDMLIQDDFGHIVMVDDKFKKGYSLYEGVQPTSSHTYRTVDGSRNGMLQSRTRESYCDDYTYLVNNKDVSGFSKSYLDFENIEIVNGSIRPWTGNKSVLGNYDKSHGGIWITVHDDARVAHITKPDGSIVDVDVQGKTVAEITDYVTMDGEYSLHSDVSDVKEYFRFFDAGHIELRFDNNRKAIFSNPNVDYAYITAEGYGISGIKDDDDDEGGSMVVANGKYYPLLTDDKIRGNAACMIWNEWGRYSCEFELTIQENENEHTPSDTEEPEQEGTVTGSESE